MTPKRFFGSTTLGDDSGVSVTLGDGAAVALRIGVSNCCSGWKKSLSLSIALLVGVPCSKDGAGWVLRLSSCRRSSMVAFSLSELVISGIGNLVGRKMTFSTGMVALVCGMKMLYCL